MIQQCIYNSELEIPLVIHKQIIDFLRIEWPDGFEGGNSTRDWVSKVEYHPVTFTLMDGETLVSHVLAVWKPILHKGVSYKLYALSGMFTYPQFRGKQYGLQVLKAAVDYILHSDADLFFVHSKLKGFYEKVGLQLNPKVRTLIGAKDKPVDSKEPVFTMFLSEKGKKGQQNFESEPFYFGEDLW